jgi:hypothetical protein
VSGECVVVSESTGSELLFHGGTPLSVWGVA